jgi:hypothetical protein
MPQQVKIATVWNKPGHNRTGQAPDYFLHETNDWLVLPYELSGLTMDEVRAHKPVVAALIEKSGGQPT